MVAWNTGSGEDVIHRSAKHALPTLPRRGKVLFVPRNEATHIWGRCMNLAIDTGCPFKWNEELVALRRKIKSDVHGFFQQAWKDAKLKGDRFKIHAERYVESIRIKGEKPKIPKYVRVFILRLREAIYKTPQPQLKAVVLASEEKRVKPKTHKRQPSHRMQPSLR